MARTGRKIQRAAAKAAAAQPPKQLHELIAVVRHKAGGGYFVVIETAGKDEVVDQCEGATMHNAVTNAIDLMSAGMDKVNVVRVLVSGEK